MEQNQNKCSHPPCQRTDTKKTAWTVSGEVWYVCPEHEREVSNLVAKYYSNNEKERMIEQSKIRYEGANIEELLEINSRREPKKGNLFDF